jgi:biotin carboxylase
MVLGAGPFQTPAIRKAASLGCQVITVDYLPDNIGHRFGHQSINCSTVDREGVLAVARELHIDGICTFSSDVAVSTVAHVSAALGLPGISPAVAATMTAKHWFRAFLKSAGFACPDFLSASRFAELGADLHRLRPPVVCKPVDASGSRGITKLDDLEPAAVEQAFLRAQRCSRTSTVCVESFVPGTEVGGDALLVDGNMVFAAITCKHMDGFVVRGHSLPAALSSRDQARVSAHLEEVCAALGYRSGPLNFDVIVGPDAVTILEMSGRNGGNGIAGVIERATGFDVETGAIHLALGERPHLPARMEECRGAGSLVFGSPTGGTLVHLCSAAELRNRVPEVFAVTLVKQPGDRVEPFEHNGNLVGFVLFDCPHADEYERLTEKIHATLALHVDPD